MPYMGYPWQLARLVDGRLESGEKLAVIRSFFQSHLCCLDSGFSERLKSTAHSFTVDDFLPAGRLRPLVEVLSVHKPVNSEIENNFARACSAAKCARGMMSNASV